MQEHNQSATHQLLLAAARQAIQQDNADFLTCLLQLPCEDVRQNYQQGMIHEQSQLLFFLIAAVKNFCRTHPEPILEEEWKNFVSSSLTRELQQNPYYQYFSEDNTVLALDQCLKTLSGLDTEAQRKDYVEKLQRKLSKLGTRVLRLPEEKTVVSGRKDSVSDRYQSYEEDVHASDEKKEREEKEKCIDLLLASDQSAHVLTTLKCQTKERAKKMLMASNIPAFIPCLDEETDTPKSLFEYAEIIRSHGTLSYLFSRYAALNKQYPSQYPSIVHDLEYADFLHHFSLPSAASHAPIYRRLAVFYSTREFPRIAQSLFYSAQAYIASGKESDKTEHDRLYAHSTDEMKKKFFAQLLRSNLQSDRLLTLLKAKKENILEKVNDADKPLLAYLLGRDLRDVFSADHASDQQMLFYLLKTQKIPADFKIRAIDFYLNFRGVDDLKQTPVISDEVCFFLRRALCQTENGDLKNDEQQIQLRALAALQNCSQETAAQQIERYKMLLQALKLHTNFLSQDIYNTLEIALMRQDGMQSFKAIEILLDQQLENLSRQNAEEEQEEKKDEEKEEKSATTITPSLPCWQMSHETVTYPKDPDHPYAVSYSSHHDDSGFEVLGITREKCVAELLAVLHTEHLFQQSDASKNLCDLLGRDLESAAHFVRFSLGDNAPLPLGIAHWYAKQHPRPAAFSFWKAIPESPGEIRCLKEMLVSGTDPYATDVIRILVPSKEERYARLTEINRAVDPNIYNAEGKKQLRILAFYLACLRCLYANVSQQPSSEKALAEQQVRYFLRQTQENPDADVERGAVLALLIHTHFFERHTPGVPGLAHTKIAEIFQLDSRDMQTPYKARAIQAAHLHQQISKDIDTLCAGKNLLKAYVQAYSELQQYEAEHKILASESKNTRKLFKQWQIDEQKLAIAQLKADGLEHMLPRSAAGLEQFNSLLDINHHLKQLTHHAHAASVYDEHIQRDAMQSDVNAVKDATWLSENTRAALYMLHLSGNERMSFGIPPTLSASMVRHFHRKFYANIEKIITNAGVIEDTKGRLISLLHSSSKQVDSRYLDVQTGAIALQETQNQPAQADDEKMGEEPDQPAAHEMSSLLAPTAAARRAATENLVNFLIHHYAEQIALLDEDSQEKFAVFLTEIAILYVCEYRRDEAEKETHKTIESFVHWLDTGPELHIQKDDVVQPYEGEEIYLRATGQTTCLDLVRRSGYRCTTEDEKETENEKEARDEIRYAIWQKDRSAPLPEIYGCKSATPIQVGAFEAELHKARDSYPWYPEDHLPAWYVEQDKTWWLTPETVAAYKNTQRHYRAIGYAVMPEEDAPAAVLQGEVAAVLVQIRAEREDEKKTHQAEIEMQNQTITALTNKFSAMMEAQEHLQNMFMQLMQKNEQMEKAQVVGTLAPRAPRPRMASSPLFFLAQRKASGAPAAAVVPANTISSGARATRPLEGEPPALPETRT